MGKTTYPCRCDVDGSECGERFTTSAKRCRHIETAHGLIACRYQDCGLGFATEEQYQKHCLGEKNHARLVCRDCIEEGQFKMFAASVKLMQHTITNHPVDRARLETMTAKPDSYWCPVCQKPFVHLKQHIISNLADPDHAALMTDEEKQPYYCSECDKFYKNLGLHRNQAHIKPFVCTEPDCEYACGTIQKMRRHLKLRHKLPVTDADAIANRTRVEWAELNCRTITSMNGIEHRGPGYPDTDPAYPPRRDRRARGCAYDILLRTRPHIYDYLLLPRRSGDKICWVDASPHKIGRPTGHGQGKARSTCNNRQ